MAYGPDRLPSGTWRVRWRMGGTRAGQMLSASFERQRDARAFAAALSSEGDPIMPRGWQRVGRTVTRDEHATSRAGVPSFRAMADAAMTAAAARGTRVGTIEDYRDLMAKHVLPFFDAQAIDTITREDIEEWQALIGEGANGNAPLSAKSVANIRGPLVSAVFRRAVEAKVIAQNPCDLVPLPKRRKARTHAIASHDVPTVLAAVSDIDDEIATAGGRYGRHVTNGFADAIYVLMTTGIRFGELSALTSADYVPAINGESARLFIWHATDRRKGGRVTGATKSAAGDRTVPLTPRAAAIVERRISIAADAGSAFLWHTATGGRLGPTTFRARWYRALGIAETRGVALPPATVTASGMTRNALPPHALRHSFISWAVGAGFDPAEIAAIVGHADTRTTLGVYTHTTGGTAARSVIVAGIDALTSTSGTAGALRTVGGIG